MEESKTKTGWEKVKAPESGTVSVLRDWVENAFRRVTPNPSKTPVVFTLGDPVLYSAFQPCPESVQILSDSVGDLNGYTEDGGDIRCRKYLAQLYSTDQWKLTEDDVYLGASCNGTIHLSNYVLADPGDTILLPHVQFPLMRIISEERKLVTETYKLIPEKNWEVDLEDLEEKLKKKPKIVHFINPSNPLGGVWRAEHVAELLSLANKYKVPVVADEIYEGMVYNKASFSSFGRLSQGQPVFVCSGYSKMGFAPGWRLGWLVCYGNPEILAPVKRALKKASLYMLKQNSIVQAQMPALVDTGFNYLKTKLSEIESRVRVFEEVFKGCPAVSVFRPTASMFGILRIDYSQLRDIKSSAQFSVKLLEEENVDTMPGHLFGDAGFVRIVLLADEDTFKEFAARVKEFVKRRLVAEPITAESQ